MGPILIGYEQSGIIRDSFRRAGFDALSCDLQPTQAPGPHLQMDFFQAVQQQDWALVIAHPPCTYLAVSGNRHYAGTPEREQAIRDVERIWDLPVPRLCIENPVGVLSRSPILPDPQYIQPYQYGENASKKTGLWLRGLPPLIPTHYVPPERIVQGKGRWANQTDSGQNKLGPSDTRSIERATTYPGIAQAMVDQWGPLVSHQKGEV